MFLVSSDSYLKAPAKWSQDFSAACRARLRTSGRPVATCWVLLAQIWPFSKLSHPGKILPTTMLRYVAIAGPGLRKMFKKLRTLVLLIRIDYHSFILFILPFYLMYSIYKYFNVRWGDLGEARWQHASYQAPGSNPSLWLAIPVRTCLQGGRVTLESGLTLAGEQKIAQVYKPG